MRPPRGYPGTALADERMGDSMFYSSGTTGKPKGILRPLPERVASRWVRAAPGRESI